MKILMGERIPFGYGIVQSMTDWNGNEVAFIPYCWIKRVVLNMWYYTLRKTKRSKWEKLLYDNYAKGLKEGTKYGRDKLIRQLLSKVSPLDYDTERKFLDKLKD